MAIRSIDALVLCQDRIADVTDDTCTLTYYCWETKSGLHWQSAKADGSVPSSPCSFAPSYKCEVIIPAIVAGDPAELRSDIAAALRRHADRLGISYAPQC